MNDRIMMMEKELREREEMEVKRTLLKSTENGFEKVCKEHLFLNIFRCRKQRVNLLSLSHEMDGRMDINYV